MSSGRPGDVGPVPVPPRFPEPPFGGGPGPQHDGDLLRRTEAFVFVEDLDHLVVQGEVRHHLVDVLRLRPGASVIASDGRGSWRQ